jgi:hypothetical protein
MFDLNFGTCRRLRARRLWPLAWALVVSAAVVGALLAAVTG